MAQQSASMTYTSPAAQRRRAQAQRRSMCCCSLMLVISVVIALVAFRGVFGRIFGARADRQQTEITFPLSIEIDRTWYYRYHLVPVSVKAVNVDGSPRRDEPPEVVVRYQGERVRLLGHFKQLDLRYDPATESWRGNWPPFWNSEPGRYTIEARTPIEPGDWAWTLPAERKRNANDDDDEAEPEGEAWAVAIAPVEVRARQRPEMPPGLCVATWEYDIRENFVGPDGSQGDWRKLFDWVEYVGADALWFRAAVTEGGGLTLDQPFKPVNLDAVPKLGAEAHARGLKFGAWAVAYSTYPKSNRGKPDYDFALDISRSTGDISYRNFISLLDDRRVKALTDFFRKMQECEEVDMVGLDYMRADRGGYEMVDKFTSEMPVRLPDNWGEWGERRRQRHVATKVEGEWQSDPKFYECWNWWRAHIDADIVRRIIDGSGIDKPTWIFVLTWLHGVQHGQDPLMFTDAGITMLAPMLYQVDDRQMFDEVVKAWGGYLKPGQVHTVPGDQVDFYWHQKMVSPRPATAELYDRIVTAHEGFCPEEPQAGAFWHDINRAANPGNLGPYSGREWALAAAAAFSKIRDSWSVYPLRVTMEAPDTHTIASSFTVTVNIENLTGRDVRNIKVAVADTPLIMPRNLTMPEDHTEPFTTVKNIDGSQTVQVPVQVRVTRADGERANRAMVAIRVTWDEGKFDEPVRNDLPRQIVVMKYVKGT